jgi:hypothetical protein
MDYEFLSESNGQVSPVGSRECEVSDSDVSSHEGNMVGVAMNTLPSVSAVTADRLFANPRKRSRVAPIPAGTSLFSDRTRWRWELAEEWVRVAGGGDALQAGGMLLRQTQRLAGIRPHGQGEPVGIRPHEQSVEGVPTQGPVESPPDVRGIIGRVRTSGRVTTLITSNHGYSSTRRHSL